MGASEGECEGITVRKGREAERNIRTCSLTNASSKKQFGFKHAIVYM